MLLPTAELKRKLALQFVSSQRCWIYSAFVTELGIEHVINSRTISNSDRLLVRCTLSDVLSGACSLSALKTAIGSGFQVRISTALHVKLYFFDSVLYVGSANLTGKGLALVGYCNDELSTEGVPSARDIEIAENLWSQGVPVDLNRLNLMEDFVSQLPLDSTASYFQWPKEIFEEERDLYCSDFPQNSLDDSLRWESRSKLERSNAYKWLLSSVIESGGSVSFGALSKKMHSDVYDDPAPYRRDIKELLNNLLELVQALQPTELAVHTPNVSQVVFLRDS